MLLVQFDAEFDFLQHGITRTLYEALTPLPWPYFVFHLWYGAKHFWSQLFNIALSGSSGGSSGGSGGGSASSGSGGSSGSIGSSKRDKLYE